MTPPMATGPREVGLMHRLYKPTIFRAIAGAIPATIHPNAITVTGQVCALAAAAAAYGGARGVTALYPLSALLHLAYLTSDNVDGMHARRTQQVSVTGELLDHGLDGLAISCLALTIGFILRIDGPFLVTFVSLPALAFLLAHWEHEQTKHFGPVTGQADGYTLGAALALVSFSFHDPPWLALSFTRANAALVLVILLFPAALVAVLGPTLRARKQSADFSDVRLAVLVMAAMHTYALAHATAWLVATTVGVFGTEVGINAIRARLSGRRGRLVLPRHLSMVIPAIPCVAFPSLWRPDGWASLAAISAVSGFALTWFRVLREVRLIDHASLVNG